MARLAALRVLTAIGVVVGIGLAYWQPRSPLLAYWLLLAIGLGATVSLTRALSGVTQRAKWIMTINAVIVAVALATTQLAARRAISATPSRCSRRWSASSTSSRFSPCSWASSAGAERGRSS